MELPLNDEVVERFGISRDERRARRQGVGREIRHADNMSALLAVVGLDPYPDIQPEDQHVSQ